MIEKIKNFSILKVKKEIIVLPNSLAKENG